MFFKSDPLSAAETALKARDWKYARTGDGTVLTGVRTDAGAIMIAIRHDPERRTLLFQMNPTKGSGAMLDAVLSGTRPFFGVHQKAGHSAAQVAQVCEALLARNYQMLLGNFERDPNDGEVRFRVALPYRDSSVTAGQVSWCIDVGVSSLAVAIKGLESILGSAAAVDLDEV